MERQLKDIVRGTKTLAAVLQEDGQKYKAAFEAAVEQSHVRLPLRTCPFVIHAVLQRANDLIALMSGRSREHCGACRC